MTQSAVSVRGFGLAACCILAFITTCLGQAQRVDNPDWSSFVPYVDSDFTSRNWDYGGYTVVNTSSFIRLTPNLAGKRGFWAAKKGLKANRWAVEFEFVIEGAPGVMIGDGMAFWFTKERVRLGPVMGRAEKWNGIGVLIDTFDNTKSKSNDPLILGILNDGTKEYDKDEDGRSIATASCSMKLKSRQHKTKGKVEYDKDSGLVVSFTENEEGKFKECFRIGKAKTEGIIPERGYMAFTAETGGLSTTHDITNIVTYTYQDAEDDTGFSEKSRKENYYKDKRKNANRADDRTHTSSSKGFPWFWVIVAMSIIGAGGFIAYRAINPSESNKRF